MSKPTQLPGVIFLLVGPSGVGKDSIKNELLKRKPKTIVKSVSVTTRDPRPDEKDGVDYFFWNKEMFSEGIENGLFIEFALVGERYYGTLKSIVLQTLSEPKILIMDLDVQGALLIKNSAKENGWKIFDVFVSPPSFKELERRLRTRDDGMSEHQIIQRLERARNEILQKEKFTYRIQNNILKSTVDRIWALAKGK